MIPLIATRQGLNQVPLSRCSEVSPKQRACWLVVVQTLLSVNVSFISVSRAVCDHDLRRSVGLLASLQDFVTVA